MAERRMFAKSIVESDAFIDMPVSTQVLYFHLGMRADDDGFVNSPRTTQRMIGASVDDLRLLIAKGYLIPFESGVVVITHWRAHNYIKNDRKKDTMCTEEMAQLSVDKNGKYLVDTKCIQNLSKMDTPRIQNVSTMETQDRLVEISKVKDKERGRFTPPTRAQVQQFCIDNSIVIDIDSFIDYYTSNGWLVGGRSHIKDWKAAVRNWQRRDKAKQTNRFASQMIHSDYTMNESDFIDN